jgi:DNA helicase-2/ATP-dependent DNA helicase PcrA
VVLPDDDTAFERVVNMPARGIGDKTIDKIREYARSYGKSLWWSAHHMLEQGAFTTRTQKGIQGFLLLIESLQDRIGSLSLAGQVEMTIAQTGLIAAYREEGGEQAIARAENLAELINAAKEFEAYRSQGENTLLAFLTHAILESGETQEKGAQNVIQLMTIHSAKGLEFPMVFIVGLEEQLFPTYNAVQDPSKLEEERRLCYVAITRAMERCVLSHAESRRQFGQTQLARPSRFLEEIPDVHKQMIRVRADFRRPYLSKLPSY